MDNCLLIFLKYPEAGKVKTRLASKIGPDNAARLYRLFVEATLKRLVDKNRHYEQLLFYTPPERGSKIEAWLGKQMRNAECIMQNFYPQIGSDLGERMLNALKTVFSNGAKKAVIIGTDSPSLDKEIIYEAFRLLKDNDIVIGPAADGGYYLIGVSLPALSGPFTGIDWGSKEVFEQTVKGIRKAKASYALLPLHYDVDTLEDLRTLKQEIFRMDVIKRSNLLDIYKLLKTMC
jgi:hypothetical protein